MPLALAAVPGSGSRAFTLTVDGMARSGVVAPVLLASALDPVESVWVVRNRLTRKFTEELAALVAKTEGAPTVRYVEHSDSSSDIWMQDTVEFAVSSYPEGSTGSRQIITPLTGLRSKHDMGLNCAPLDARVREMVTRELPAAVPVDVGEPLPGRRWIDWYGNLEVSPPVRGFPLGRILTGEQKGLRIHPDLITFLEQQTVQGPPLFLDVSWLTIGHVDELINFVPAPDRKGFRALLPSPALALRLLEEAIRTGHGDSRIFSGRKSEISAQNLRSKIGLSEETATITAALARTRTTLHDELGLEDADIVELPALFQDGLAVLPNPVNSLVLGKTVLIPAPEGPKINGADLFQKAIRERLEPLGLRLHFMDIWEPYHTRSGEIHCGTNTVRRLRNPQWWDR
ncbi:MAG: hypothetical protein OHK0029_40750 [Armatimonadaceae bacterium]